MKAALQTPLASGKVRCDVCAFRCELSDDQVGICRVRRNDGGEINYLAYEALASVCPAVGQCAAGTYCITQPGCNWTCSFCVTASDTNPELDFMSPWADDVKPLPLTGDGYLDKPSLIRKPLALFPLEKYRSRTPQEIVDDWQRSGEPGFAIRSTEPSIHFEAVAEIFAGVKERGGFVMIGTNGYWTPELVAALGPLVDIVDLGIKASANPLFMRKVAGVPNTEAIFATLEGLPGHDIAVTVSDIPVWHRDWESDFGRVCSAIRSHVPARDFPRLRLRPWGGRIPQGAFGHFKVGKPVRVPVPDEPAAGFWTDSRTHLLADAVQIALEHIESVWIDTGHLAEGERVFLLELLNGCVAEDGAAIRVARTAVDLGPIQATERLDFDWQDFVSKAQDNTTGTTDGTEVILR